MILALALLRIQFGYVRTSGILQHVGAAGSSAVSEAAPADGRARSDHRDTSKKSEEGKYAAEEAPSSFRGHLGAIEAVAPRSFSTRPAAASVGVRHDVIKFYRRDEFIVESQPLVPSDIRSHVRVIMATAVFSLVDDNRLQVVDCIIICLGYHIPIHFRYFTQVQFQGKRTAVVDLARLACLPIVLEPLEVQLQQRRQPLPFEGGSLVRVHLPRALRGTPAVPLRHAQDFGSGEHLPEGGLNRSAGPFRHRDGQVRERLRPDPLPRLPWGILSLVALLAILLLLLLPVLVLRHQFCRLAPLWQDLPHIVLKVTGVELRQLRAVHLGHEQLPELLPVLLQVGVDPQRATQDVGAPGRGGGGQGTEGVFQRA
mmetsp:Transcript_35093/g.74859  ORF Transcript_35093/g.74859 Transcript_35093/m.74859 type:complete len:370 (-) Transcript_35093:732-1841(-)